MIDDDWLSSRLETTYREARTVLDAQNEVIGDIDEKAMRTVRVSVVLVGLIVSAVEIAGGRFNWLWLTVGGITFLGSLVTGVLAYSESTLYLGPRRRYIEQLRRDEFDDRDWSQDLLATYGEWIEQNDRTVRRNGRLLFLTQLLLITGVTFTAAAIAF